MRNNFKAEAQDFQTDMVQKLRADPIGVMLSFNEWTNILNQNFLSIIFIISEGEVLV